MYIFHSEQPHPIRDSSLCSTVRTIFLSFSLSLVFFFFFLISYALFLTNTLTNKKFNYGLICPQCILQLFQCTIVMLFAHNSFFCLFTFCNRGFWMATCLQISTDDLGWFFTVWHNIDCFWEEFNSVVNSEAVFLLCLLLSIIMLFASAAVFTYGVPVLYLSTYVSVFNYLCNEYYTQYLEIFNFLTICLWE